MFRFTILSMNNKDLRFNQLIKGLYFIYILSVWGQILVYYLLLHPTHNRYSTHMAFWKDQVTNVKITYMLRQTYIDNILKDRLHSFVSVALSISGRRQKSRKREGWTLMLRMYTLHAFILGKRALWYLETVPYLETIPVVSFY